jgi:mono/diheme cytochrome c family protein
MKLTITRLINLAIGIVSVSFLAATLLAPAPASASVQDQFDAAGTYKTKCAACHGAAAEKRFDKTLTDEQLIDAVLKGKKPDKPPNMPAFEAKGITADQAKALVDYMKSIKQ